MLQEIGFGLTREIVGCVIMDYLMKIGRPNPFKDKPGFDWWKGFLKRWPKLAERKAQHLSRKRAEGASHETVQNFFEKVENVLITLGIRHAHDLADRLWNCDESGLCGATTSNRILAKRGSRWVHDTAGGSGRSYTTIHGCGSASGIRLPPFVVYKGKNLYGSWTKGGAAGAQYSVSESGWMETANYESWFKKMFLPFTKHLRDSGPIILYFDGHYSHVSIKLIELSRENNVNLILLPSNTTHVLQPLDVGVYGPLKQGWKKILGHYKMKTKAANIGKEEFPKLVAELWDTTFKPEHLIGGFRESGLYPFCQTQIPSWKLSLSLPFKANSVVSAGAHTETPLRTELRKCFTDALKPTEVRQQQRRKKVQLIHYGEALTNDEVFERLKKEEDEKERKLAEKKLKAASKAASKKIRSTKQKKSRKKSAKRKSRDIAIPADEEHCQICGDEFEEGEEDICLGCDDCWRWVHCHCAGMEGTPDEDIEWLCSECSS